MKCTLCRIRFAFSLSHTLITLQRHCTLVVPPIADWVAGRSLQPASFQHLEWLKEQLQSFHYVLQSCCSGLSSMGVHFGALPAPCRNCIVLMQSALQQNAVSSQTGIHKIAMLMFSNWPIDSLSIFAEILLLAFLPLSNFSATPTPLYWHFQTTTVAFVGFFFFSNNLVKHCLHCPLPTYRSRVASPRREQACVGVAEGQKLVSPRGKNMRTLVEMLLFTSTNGLQTHNSLAGSLLSERIRVQSVQAFSSATPWPPPHLQPSRCECYRGWYSPALIF